MRKNPQTSHVRVGVSISPTVPRTCPVTGPRGFAISGPVIWNSLSDTWSPRSVSVCCEFLTPTQLLKTVNRAWNHSIFVIVYYKRGRNINLLYPSHHTPWSWLKCLRDARCNSWVKPTATPSSLPGLGHRCLWFRRLIYGWCVLCLCYSYTTPRLNRLRQVAGRSAANRVSPSRSRAHARCCVLP